MTGHPLTIIMNEQSSKKILFNKSTLFNLKAELLKKQEEVNEKKQLPQHKVENFKPPKPEKEKSEKNKKSFKDGLKAVDVEEIEACRKSKVALEKKAELYNHLAGGIGTSQLADRFLVDFQTKKQEDVKEAVLSAIHKSTDDIQTIEGDNDEWTEFTDCLGRTRKCHKSDLQMFRKRDQELKRATRKDHEDVPEMPEVQEEKETPLLVQKTNDYLQSLREKWEEKEREMIGKDRDIHYQDLLFDEARIHGVGYFSFSTDEKERRKQMDELLKTRQETLQAQKETEELRKKREVIMAARVKAARARQRARAGLPPEEEPEEDRESFTTRLLEFLTQQRDEADLKAKEEENKLKEEQEKERQKLREAYIREWDVGKDGVEDKVKKFREMTQEEYVEQQRNKRIDEFAPFRTASTSKSSNTFNDSGSMIGVDNASTKTWSDVRPKPKTPPPPDLSDFDIQKKGLYFSSKQQKEDGGIPSSRIEKKRSISPTPISYVGKRDLKYKNFVRAMEPTAIVNELSDNDNDVDGRGNDERITEGNEIAPPPTYDYYGPIPKKVKHQKPFQSDIREAYAQGTKSLESKPSSRQLSENYDFTFG